MADNLSSLGRLCDDEIPYESSPSPNEDMLSKFLANFTAKLHYSEPESERGLYVFWSEDLPYSDDGGYNAIKSAFCEAELCYFDGFIQFWAPVETGSQQLLTTYNQPFALKYLNSGLEKYRLCSLKYQYNIDVDKLKFGVEETMIISGPPANAFMSHLAEVVLDMSMRLHHGCPLVRSALECELMSYFVMPIRYPSKSQCVGVVECYAHKLDDLLKIFNDLNSALKRAGLRTFHGQERVPYERTGGLKCATDEIEEALQRVCESHDLTLAQLWISYEDDNHAPFSTSLEDTRRKRIMPLKLIAHCDNSDVEDCLSYKDYYGICDMLPLKIGEGFVEKALQNYEPHLCRYIYERSINELPELCPKSNNEPPKLCPVTITERSCFVICLKSIETGNLDYVLEFLWLGNRNHIILLESLILTLKMSLPNFKFASGAELGDELRVLDLKFDSSAKLGDELSVLHFKFACGGESGDVNSFKYRIENFKIFEGKKSSPISTVIEIGKGLVADDCIAKAKSKTTEKPLSREDIEQQFGITMREAAKNLDVSVSTLKRKCKFHGISEWQGPKLCEQKSKRLVRESK